MFRLVALWMVISALAVYAFRDWYKSLCGLILLLAVIEHPDFPKSLFGVQGLNPWNILLVFIVAAWLAARKKENLQWDMPKPISRLLLVYFAFIMVSTLRLMSDPAGYLEYNALIGEDPPTSFSMISEYLINCFKWVIPGIMLYDGCRSKERLRFATFTIVSVYVLLAIQVVRWMPFAALSSGDALEARSIKILINEVGYHRVNMSMMLAGASWAIYCTRDIVKSNWIKLGLLGPLRPGILRPGTNWRTNGICNLGGYRSYVCDFEMAQVADNRSRSDLVHDPVHFGGSGAFFAGIYSGDSRRKQCAGRGWLAGTAMARIYIPSPLAGHSPGRSSSKR